MATAAHAHMKQYNSAPMTVETSYGPKHFHRWPKPPLLLATVSLNFNLHRHSREAKFRHANRRPKRAMVRTALLHHLDKVVQVTQDVGLVASDGVDVFPTTQPGGLKYALDVVKGVVDLALPVFGVQVAVVVPAALTGALDDVAEDDALRVVVHVALYLSGALFVDVC